MNLNQKGSFLPILGVIVLLVVIAGGAYYLGTQNIKNSQNAQISTSPKSPAQPTTIESPTNPPIQNTNSLPSDWAVKNSVICNVKIPLPPKKEPYYIPDNPSTAPATNDEGGFWSYEERGSGNENDKFFINESISIFKNPNKQGSGYVAGMVQVICGPNNKGYTTQSFVDAYAKQYTDGTFSGLDFKQDGKKALWGHEVIQATITGGMFNEDDKEYYFATPSKLYQIRTISLSSNQTIKDTTKQIFNNLQFVND